MELTLTVEKLVSQGTALARHNGKSVFVAGALPGEVVKVEVVEQKRDYDRAVVRELLHTAQERVEPQCPYYWVCGGCDFQHANAESQLEFKLGVVLENLMRIGSLDASFVETQLHVLPPARSPAWGYRSRGRFHVSQEYGDVGF